MLNETNQSIISISGRTHLYIGAFELGLQLAVLRVAGNMEAVAVRITDQHIPSIRNVDTIREACDFFAANTILKSTLFGKYCYTVALKVTNEEVRSYEK